MASTPEQHLPASTNRDFVAWFRSVAPYMHAFRGKTLVIAFGGEVVDPLARDEPADQQHPQQGVHGVDQQPRVESVANQQQGDGPQHLPAGAGQPEVLHQRVARRDRGVAR